LLQVPVFKINVVPDAEFKPCNVVVAYNSPITIYKLICANRTSQVKFSGRDKNGRSVVCEARGANGQFDLMFTPTIGGRITFEVNIDGETDLMGVPDEGFHIDLPENSKPSSSSSSLSSSQSQTVTEIGVWVGYPYTMNINLGSAKISARDLDCCVISPTGKKQTYTPLENPLRLVFTPNEAGNYTINFIYQKNQTVGSTSVTVQHPK